jgi:hypothetical protein
MAHHSEEAILFRIVGKGVQYEGSLNGLGLPAGIAASLAPESCGAAT